MAWNRLFYSVQPGEKDLSIEKHLSIHFPFLAPSLLHCGAVWSNNQRLEEGDILQAEQNYWVVRAKDQEVPYTLKNEHILYEDEQLLAVHKPPCLPVDQDFSTRYHHLSHGVAQYLNFKNAKPAGRLDFFVQGMVLYGKNKQAQAELFSLLQERKVQKLYFFVLERSLKAANRRPVDQVAFSAGKCHLSEDGKTAKSHFYPFTKQTGLARLITGRRHQLRFHLSHYHSPIFGDRDYGALSTFNEEKGIALGAYAFRFQLAGKDYHLRHPFLVPAMKESFCTQS